MGILMKHVKNLNNVWGWGGGYCNALENSMIILGLQNNVKINMHHV